MSHTHTHGCCNHCLHHCGCCNEVYCCKCGETWGKHYYYPWTYPYVQPYITWTYDGSTTTTGDYKFGSTCGNDGGKITVNACSHKHKGGE
jgi:hypothetical protein